MTTFIRKPDYVETYSYELGFFDRDTDSIYYAFPCDTNGNVDMAYLERLPKSLKNYNEQTSNPSLYSKVIKIVHSHYDKGAIKCNVCGHTVELDDSWANCCYHCETEYNGSGQQLADRSQWGEETGEVF